MSEWNVKYIARLDESFDAGDDGDDEAYSKWQHARYLDVVSAGGTFYVVATNVSYHYTYDKYASPMNVTREGTEFDLYEIPESLAGSGVSAVRAYIGGFRGKALSTVAERPSGGQMRTL